MKTRYEYGCKVRRVADFFLLKITTMTQNRTRPQKACQNTWDIRINLRTHPAKHTVIHPNNALHCANAAGLLPPKKADERAERILPTPSTTPSRRLLHRWRRRRRWHLLWPLGTGFSTRFGSKTYETFEGKVLNGWEADRMAT